MSGLPCAPWWARRTAVTHAQARTHSSMSTSETLQQLSSPDAKRLRLHRALQQKIGATVADDLMDFLPPSGWGDLARKSDLDALEKRLESRMDSLDSRVDAVERQIVELRNEVRALGNLRHTIVLTGASLAISLFVGLGGLMVAVVQLTGR